MTEKKYFPIKTATACQLKWGWSTIFLNDGTTASCHRVGRHNFSLDEFDSFHNTPEKIRQRNEMLAGRWPQPIAGMEEDQGCRYCQKIEQEGGQSDRMFQMQIPDLSPPEIFEDPTAVVVTPTMVEVFISNTCNLSCTYCDSKNSSKIENENIKYGRFTPDGTIIVSDRVDKNLNQQYIKRFFEWLQTNSNSLRRLNILGGEPLFQKEFEQILDFFDQHPNPELELSVFTNLMIDSDRFNNIVDRWKKMIAQRKLKRFDVTVSLDCGGAEQEYARYGLKWETINQNMQRLLKEKWIYLCVNSSLSPLTIRTFNVLIKQILEWKSQRSLDHYFQSVFTPAYHNPAIYGTGFWKADFETAIDCMPRNNWQENNMYDYLVGIYKQINSAERKPDQILILNKHLDELDRRRGTDWRSLFPYLELK